MGASIILFVLVGAILGSAAVVLSTKAVLLLAAGLAGTVMVMSSKGAYFALIATMPIYFGFARGITIPEGRGLVPYEPERWTEYCQG